MILPRIFVCLGASLLPVSVDATEVDIVVAI
jgi:hypothetical protein